MIVLSKKRTETVVIWGDMVAITIKRKNLDKKVSVAPDYFWNILFLFFICREKEVISRHKFVRYFPFCFSWMKIKKIKFIFFKSSPNYTVFFYWFYFLGPASIEIYFFVPGIIRKIRRKKKLFSLSDFFISFVDIITIWIILTLGNKKSSFEMSYMLIYL